MPEYTTLISAAELAAIAGEDGSDRGDERGNVCRILDCRFDLMAPLRGRQWYLEGHVPGAVHADLDRDLSGPVTAASGRHPLPEPGVLAATLGRLGIDNATQVVAYDAANSAFAARAWWLLRWAGHDRVAVLDGGLAAWVAAGGTLEPGEVQVRERRFVPRMRHERVVDTAEVARAVAAGAPLTLVDAREAERFRGDAEPIDPVAGHIPGALNFPLGRSLTPEGRWLPPRALSEAWSPVLRDAAQGPWTVMCGSGVTACHLALSGVLAGFPEPRVYAGSWSEWIRDPERPVATGPGSAVAESPST